MNVADPAHLGLSRREQEAIVRAAVAAHEGKHAEAEATRYAGGYHDLRVRSDADGFSPAI